MVFETDDSRLREELTAAGAVAGKFHCADRIVITAREKTGFGRARTRTRWRWSRRSSAGSAGNMQLPFATVRVISDAADEDLPLDFNSLSKPDRSLDYGKLALAVAKSPGKIGALMRLQKQTRLAAQELAEVLARVIFP